jgi:hypothetical protein
MVLFQPTSWRPLTGGGVPPVSFAAALAIRAPIESQRTIREKLVRKGHRGGCTSIHYRVRQGWGL